MRQGKKGNCDLDSFRWADKKLITAINIRISYQHHQSLANLGVQPGYQAHLSPFYPCYENKINFNLYYQKRGSSFMPL